ncbi:F-box protein pof6 [Apiospora saccharicola]|uniref:F-box protein pof6 n=1 Tax=Apiospora saccharicola TaxID=335842 RepID=A0ABR1TM09_9PEZI
MSNYKRASQPGRSSILSTLQATTMLDTKPILPAEILVSILDFLPVSDQINFAKTSRRMKEMVYDDTRWISRLHSMGCWDEAEARRRFEDAIKRKREAAERANAAAAGATPLAAKRTTLFDAGQEEERRKKLAEEAAKAPEIRVDGFETLSLHASTKNSQEDPSTILDVYKNVRSIRGYARQEYGKIYGALAPFYYDLAAAKSHTEPAVFKAFRDPEKQAQMLRNLQRFSQNDWAQGWNERGEVLTNMCNIFENAVLREFEQGYEFMDVEGRMRRYAHVLHDLNGGNAAMEVFISKHPILNNRDALGNPMDCINQAPEDGITLEPSRAFFKAMAMKINEQSAVISQIFPDAEAVFWSLLDRIREDIIVEYITPILDESHDRNLEAYLKAASGLFEQCMAFVGSLDPPSKSKESLEKQAKDFGLKTFDLHLDLYFREELDFFTRYAEREVLNWEQKLSEQDASVESFFMSSFNRRADKNDFLSSFKKVVMMPVSVLPTIPISSPFGSSKAASAAAPRPDSIAGMPGTSKTTTPNISGSLEPKTGPLPSEAPTDELKAKAALMANRLEGIKSLFSIEVALDLVGNAKEGLGRVAVFIRLGGQAGEEAREQCEAIFISLLQVLGQKHVKNGFVKAVEHLSKYKAREVSDHQAGVAPLVTFIELVNVGDLISQMIDMFYEQQLAAPKISDRNDFLDPAGLAKKKWEQMLDESVAAGLNKGIDVLMDEVEYICATTQLPTDYNPAPDGAEEKGGMQQGGDMGPTQTAIRVRDLVASHTNMLVGSTEKTMLDVFNGEVGLRLFTAICKHLKRQRVSTEGAIKLIADTTLYFEYIRGLKNQDLLAYFKALRELSQIYLIDAKHAKEMATIIADGDRFGGIFRAEEVYEYAERRADWYQVKRNVERAMYGMDCSVM